MLPRTAVSISARQRNTHGREWRRTTKVRPHGAVRVGRGARQRALCRAGRRRAAFAVHRRTAKDLPCVLRPLPSELTHGNVPCSHSAPSAKGKEEGGRDPGGAGGGAGERPPSAEVKATRESRERGGGVRIQGRAKAGAHEDEPTRRAA